VQQNTKYGGGKIKEIGKIVGQLWEETAGIEGEKLVKIVSEIDDVFHKNGYVVSHDKIAHFIMDCIRED